MTIIAIEIQFQLAGAIMKEERKIFYQFIRKKGLRFTRQRAVLLKFFLRQRKHLSVDEFHRLVRRKYPEIGRSTVFRTLKLLSEAGLAQQVDLGDKIVRYEPKYGHPHHDHLICERCGKLIEFVDYELEKLQDDLCKKFGFLPRRHHLEIFGFCSECRKSQKEEENCSGKIN